MKRTLALAAVALIATPAAAAPSPCRGGACREVTPVWTQGCWAYRSSAARSVLGIVYGNEEIRFQIAPGGLAFPKTRSGQCLQDTWPYQVEYEGQFKVRRPPR